MSSAGSKKDRLAKAHLSHQIVRSARDAVNSSDSLAEVMSKNPYKSKRMISFWEDLARGLFLVSRHHRMR